MASVFSWNLLQIVFLNDGIIGAQLIRLVIQIEKTTDYSHKDNCSSNANQSGLQPSYFPLTCSVVFNLIPNASFKVFFKVSFLLIAQLIGNIFLPLEQVVITF